ncbi:uncharacterized protein LOC123565069 [Mercenaria mercenaria]|uniref:uncharacterized protein LOC123565069 n=1 Tax=Mercenaria mercenaria TaxID=6596 RepID=UPI00234F7347|nr:uncharacterized protein LOC123565069 [Mercenaria mercenaria]
MNNVNMTTSNTTEETVIMEKKSGYDLPVYGLATGSFYYIHIPALCCIFLSFCSVVTVMILSFKRKSWKTFFTTWSKSERFIVYLAFCDGCYNVFHSVDHLHYVISKDHVRPKELCEFYGFTLAESIMGQNLMVNIVAINAFMLMYFNKNLDFGRRDWKLLAWTFGLPFVGATIAGILGQLGPNGSFCYFDGVKGVTANMCFTTVPLLIIIVMNSVMYVLTWKRIKEQTRNIRSSMKESRGSTKSRSTLSSSQRAARTMSMFVVAFFIQWWSLALFGVWALVDDDVPQVIFHFVTTFTNIGGCLNLGIFLIMRYRLQQSETTSETQSESKKLELRDTKTKSTDSGNVSTSDPNIQDENIL